MAVRFVLGRAGTGKTRHCVDAIVRELSRARDATLQGEHSPPLGGVGSDFSRKLIFLVPEQASFQMERALALRAPGGGYWRAEVLSFSRLARRVFDELGTPPVELSPQARRMALRVVAGRCAGALKAFGKAAKTAGFFAQLDRVIEELLAEDVGPEKLRQALARGTMPLTGTIPLTMSAPRRAGEKGQAIADIYAEYLAWLGTERIDPAARLAALRERLTRVEWLRDAAVWVDGFAGFTGQERETLVAVARGARGTTITLLLDPEALHEPGAGDDSLRLFQRTEMTYRRLTGRLGEEGVAVEPPLSLDGGRPARFVASGVLTRLEWNLSGGHGQVQSDLPMPPTSGELPMPAVSFPPGVRVLECATHREELRKAARCIRRSVIESGGAARFRDFAVIARDLEPFAHLVAEVFEEFELPYFLDRRRAMASHALCRLVRGLLEAATSDCAGEAMVRLLRSGLAPVSRGEAEELENAVIASEVRGLEAWRRESWEFGADVRASHLDAARRRIVRAVEGLHALTRKPAAGDWPTSLFDLRPFDTAPTGADWVRQLYAAIQECGAERRLSEWIDEARRSEAHESAEVHRLAWEALCELLDDIDAVLGKMELTASEFAEIVNAGLSEVSLGLAPPTLDQVLVGSIERSRHPEIKHAWIMAFNEGVFPKPPAEDGLLGTAEREALAAAGLEALGPRREDALAERMLAYIACTRPSHELTISFARTGEDGEARMPSPLLEDVRVGVPGLEVTRATDDEPPVCLAELASRYLRVVAGGRGEAAGRGALLGIGAVPRTFAAADLALAARLERVVGAMRSQAVSGKRLEWILRGTQYQNKPGPIPKDMLSQSGEQDARRIVWRGSPTQLETYVLCPFKHFADKLLKIKPRRRPNPIEWDLGSVAHDVLASVTRKAIDAGGSVREVTDRKWLLWLRNAAAEHGRKQPTDWTERRPRAAFLSNVLYRMLRHVLLAHTARWRRGQFEPHATEMGIGEARRAETCLAALEVELSNGQWAQLIGWIDRFDGGRDADGILRLVAYDYKSTAVWMKQPYLTGGRLQCFVYLLALEQAYCGGATTKIAGVFLAPLFPNREALKRPHVVRAPRAEQRMYAFQPRGVFDSEFVSMLDSEMNASPRPSAPSPVASMNLNKDGTFHRHADARPASEIAEHMKLARRTIKRAANGIVKGEINVSPLLEGRTLACHFCEFRPLCRFDPALNRPRRAEKHLPVLGSTDDVAEAGE